MFFSKSFLPCSRSRLKWNFCYGITKLQQQNHGNAHYGHQKSPMIWRYIGNHNFCHQTQILPEGSSSNKVTSNACSNLQDEEESEAEIATYADLGNALYGQPPAPEGSRAAQRTYALISRLEWHEALAMIGNHHASLDKTHYALTMKHLHRQLLRLPHELRAEFIAEVKQEQSFEVLKALLALRGQYYEPGIAAEMLLFLRRFELDSDDPTIKVYLHLVKYHLADLPLDLVVKVAQAVNTMTADPQIDLILEGVPLLERFDPRVIDNLTPWEAVYLLDVFGKDMDEKSIAATISVIGNGLPLIKKHLSKVLFHALGSLRLHLEELIQHCLFWFLAYPEDLKMDDVISILKSCQQMGFYDVELFRCILDKTRELGSFSDKFHVLRRYFECGIYDASLARDVSCNFDKSIVHRTQELLSLEYPSYQASGAAPSELFFFHDLLHTMALGSSSIESPEKIKEMLGYVEDCAHYLSVGELLSLLLDLAVLNEHSDILMSRFLSLAEEWLGEEESGHGQSEAIPDRLSSCLPEALLSKAQLVNLVCARTKSDVPISLVTLLSRKLSESCAEPGELAGGLEMVCLGPQHVQHATTSTDGLHINHVVSLPNDWPEVQDSEEPGTNSVDHERIAVLALDSHCFFRNTGQLKPHTRGYATQLQREGYLVVLVKLPIWRRIPDHERPDYLRRKLSHAAHDQELLMLGMDGY